MKIKSTQKIDLGMNIKDQIEKSGLRKVDLIRQMQLSGIEINKLKDCKTLNMLPSLLIPVLWFLIKSIIQ